MTTVQDMINETLGEWTKIFLQNRIEKLKKADLLASQKLLNSLQTDIRKATADQVASAFLAFEPYGRFLDIKRLKRVKGGKEYIENLKKWIKQTGTGKFQKVYKRKSDAPQSEDALLNKIAWGIAKTKRRRKRKKWYTSEQENDLDLLYSMLLNGYQKTVSKDIKKQFTNGSSAR